MTDNRVLADSAGLNSHTNSLNLFLFLFFLEKRILSFNVTIQVLPPHCWWLKIMSESKCSLALVPSFRSCPVWPSVLSGGRDSSLQQGCRPVWSACLPLSSLGASLKWNPFLSRSPTHQMLSIYNPQVRGWQLRTQMTRDGLAGQA